MPADRAIETELPPAGITWAEYVGRWVRDRGGWINLADELIHRVGDSAEIARDPQTVERGLRRLAKRGHKPGGQYGQWMIRFFGFTSSVERWVKWMGQYHTRFTDLPSGLRLEQLALWNRPPVSESRLSCWIDVGIAAAHLSRLDLESCRHWLERARRRAALAGAAAEVEVHLLCARAETDDRDYEAAQRRYRLVEDLLDDAGLPLADELPYRARLQDQRAHHCTRPPEGRRPDLARARRLYESIPEDPAMPFVLFRKFVGLAYCAWKLGDEKEAVRLAQLAVDHAGDGGLVRMRVMALNMLSRVLPDEEARRVRERARQMATLLEDEDLLRRTEYCVPDSED